MATSTPTTEETAPTPVSGWGTRAALLVLTVAALGVWSASLPVGGAGGPLAYAGVFAVLVTALVPATPLTLAAGALYGPAAGAALTSAATTAAAAASFVIARYAAHDRVAAWLRGRPRVGAAVASLAGPGAWRSVIALRLSHTLPFGVQNYLLGLTPVRFVPYLAATWVSMLPGAVIYSYLGHLGAAAAAGEAVHIPGGWAVRAAALTVAVVALLYLGHAARRALRDPAA